MACAEPNWETCTKESINRLLPILEEVRESYGWLYGKNSTTLHPEIIGECAFHLDFTAQDVLLSITFYYKKQTYLRNIRIGSVWNRKNDYLLWGIKNKDDIFQDVQKTIDDFYKYTIPDVESSFQSVITSPTSIIMLFALAFSSIGTLVYYHFIWKTLLPGYCATVLFLALGLASFNMSQRDKRNRRKICWPVISLHAAALVAMFGLKLF